ncbi:MAG: hypothetical protein HY588_01675 [Candidatus Omnitrophica bacterium]|nr:hypothetical protein [Candidatus Omnitrophota bacterium]
MKKKAKPKPRHTWRINPKTRIKENKKNYDRKRERKKILKQLDWFGDKS